MNTESSIKNLLTHGAGQFVNLLVPFFVGIYVIPICGIANWGIIGVATAVFVLIGILVEFGANLIGVKELSSYRLHHNYVKKYIGLNYKFRLYCCLIITPILAIVFVVFKADLTFYWGLTWMIGWYYNPLWIYQAKEDFKTINQIIILSKLIYVIIIVLVIHSATDYKYVVGLLGLSNSLVYAFYYYKIPKTSVSFKRILLFVRQNKTIVLSNFAINGYIQAPVFIINIVLGDMASGIYKVIDLFLTAFRSYLGVFFNVTFPKFCYLMKISLKRAKAFSYKMLFLNVLFLCLASIIIFISLPYILDTFDLSLDVRNGLNHSKFLLFLPVIIAFNIPFYQMLLYQKQDNVIVSVSIIGLLLTLILGFCLTYAYSLIGAFVMLYIVEFFITGSLWFKSSKLSKV
ncbi:MAG TPA: oligosaccharide flippase family protein [Flavobacterium sp.]|nr:oligosaccharide flippase family protein [Flavobacterium sp.]